MAWTRGALTRGVLRSGGAANLPSLPVGYVDGERRGGTSSRRLPLRLVAHQFLLHPPTLRSRPPVNNCRRSPRLPSTEGARCRGLAPGAAPAVPLFADANPGSASRFIVDYGDAVWRILKPGFIFVMASSGLLWALSDYQKLPNGKPVAVIVLDGWGGANPDQHKFNHVCLDAGHGLTQECIYNDSLVEAVKKEPSSII